MTEQVVSKQLLPYSPRGVVDMALFHLDDNAKTLQDYSLLAPPLNSVSVCSSTSASSLDADDDDDAWEEESKTVPTAKPRMIFGSYWKVKGGRPKEPLRGSSSTSSRVMAQATEGSSKTTTTDGTITGDSCEDVSSLPLSPQEEYTDSYEDILEQSSFSMRRPAAAPLGDDSGASLGSSSRRRLWGDNRYSESAPSLPQCVALPSDCLRKTQSSRGLGEGRPLSCLKERRRYSGPSTALRRPSKTATVVSFSDDVEVKILQTQTVVFAERGWSRYFNQ
jgi:hypothetical protein